MSLLDQFNQRLAETETPVAQQDVQSQVQKVLTAKQGKATAGAATPQASSLGQQAAQDQVQQAQKQQQFQGAIAGAQIGQAEDLQKKRVAAETDRQDIIDDSATQERLTKEILVQQQIHGSESLASEKLSADRKMRINAVNSIVRQKMATMASDRDSTLEDLWSTFQRSEKELAFRKDAAAIEQVGFLMSLQDQQYTAELDRIGRRRMLEDEIQFEQEIQSTRLGNAMTSFLDGIDFLEVFNSDKRDYTEQLSKIDLNTALSIAEAAIKDASSQRMWEAGTNAVSAGVDYYAKPAKKEP